MSGSYTINVNASRAKAAAAAGAAVPTNIVNVSVTITSTDYKGSLAMDYEYAEYTVSGTTPPTTMFVEENETVQIDFDLDGTDPSEVIVTASTSTQMESDQATLP